MRAQLNRLVGLILLGSFIPAVLGFAFIHHHCSVCQSDITEASLSIIPHQHNTGECYCQVDTAESCHSENQEACNCHLNTEEKHDHSCKVKFKNLSFTGTVLNNARVLPNPTELDFNFVALLSCPTLTAVDTPSQQTVIQPNSDPPLPGEDLSILHCVFRL